MDVPGTCGEAVIVRHGHGNGFFVENNLMTESVNLNGSSGCWAMGFGAGYGTGEGFSNVIVRGNSVINYNRGILIDICDTCLIENNYVYQKDWTGIAWGTGSGMYVGDTVSRNVIIRNNTIDLTQPSSLAVGILFNRAAADPANGGGNKIYSNIILMASTAPSSANCMSFLNLTAASFAGVDYNQCYSSSATPPGWNTLYGSLASTQAAGLDLHSTFADPGLTVGAAPAYPLTITGASAAYNTGSPTNSSPYAIGEFKRGGTGAPSKGAFEPNATVVLPGTPTKIQIQ